MRIIMSAFERHEIYVSGINLEYFSSPKVSLIKRGGKAVILMANKNLVLSEQITIGGLSFTFRSRALSRREIEQAGYTIPQEVLEEVSQGETAKQLLGKLK